MSDQQWPPLDRAIGKIAFLAILTTVLVLTVENRMSGESILQAIASLAGTAGAWRGSVPAVRRPGRRRDSAADGTREVGWVAGEVVEGGKDLLRPVDLGEEAAERVTENGRPVRDEAVQRDAGDVDQA
jgi:hypothetical protein